MSTAAAPVEIGRITLIVHDLPRVAAFYQRALGLARLSGDGTEVVLGAGARPLVVVRADPAARPRDPRGAGLFHTAFLMPDRAALGRWLRHAAATGVRIEGASDHIVSEALYLSDPEGNGIEIYADHPRAAWTGPDGAIRMATERLDLDALAAAADRPWAGAPDGAVIGHVHLQVGEIAAAEEFFPALGLALTARYPGASFFAAGGYHHHIGANVWNSRGAGPRPTPETGLAEVVLHAEPDAFAAATARFGGTEIADPWGTRMVLAPKPA
ncbi:MAG: VOC family protein [Rhodobacteraceae bacterium]|nr:VOC family protein [Paracoccaceae bacterium]